MPLRPICGAALLGHTFATLALMAGNTPAWVARQLGHVNAQIVFRVYAKWIDRADKSRERDRFNAALSHVSGHTRRQARGK